MIVTVICFIESGSEGVSQGFSYSRAPCWLLLAVLPAVRVGGQTASVAFIQSSHARQLLETAPSSRALKLTITDKVKCQWEGYDFTLILEYSPLLHLQNIVCACI